MGDDRIEIARKMLTLAVGFVIVVNETVVMGDTDEFVLAAGMALMAGGAGGFVDRWRRNGG